MTSKEIKAKVCNGKRKVLDMCVSANKGHLTSAFSCAEIVSVLYYSVMRVNPKQPNWDKRDRLIMSKNHGSLMLYPILADLGFFPESELDTFMRDGTRLGGHSKLALEGIDFAGGSLGIGLGVGVGLAYAAKMDENDYLTFVVIGDGECYEGSIWEAAMVAAHNRLGNLVAILDRNRLSCTDFTEKILRLEPLEEKWQAFGWDVCRVNGHDIDALRASLDGLRNRVGDKPRMVIADTVKGHGIDFMSDAPLCHGLAPEKGSEARAYSQLEGH
jgi:transketolase